ncbi:MAG: hypothetical protein PHZ09_12145 [Eubacteriales bacterium]|nr:hypothetical protein [Eubacteriales bacterium]
MKNKIISVLIPFIALLTLAGCAQQAEDDNTAFAADTEAARDIITSGLEAVDYEGADFGFLDRSKSGLYNDHPYEEIAASEQNGETLNDAVYTRNIIIEEKYNINITSAGAQDHGRIYTVFEETILAGDNAFYAAMPNLTTAFKIATKQYALNINDIPNLDPHQPWWSDEILDSTSVGNKNCFIPGSLNLSLMNTVGITYFNKQLVSEYNLENPYDYVNAGKWTLDSMAEISVPVTRDLDGNGIMDEKDLYGIVCSSFAWQPLFYGTGNLLIVKDEEDMPRLNAGNEVNYNAVARVIDLIDNCDTTLNVNNRSSVTQNLGQVTIDVFNEGRAVFFIELIYGVPQFRDMDDDFGLLPMPKYDENQRDYYSYIHTAKATACVVPVTNGDGDMTGRILEDMSCESYKLIRPAFYDVMLKTKYTRDEESSEMLDIILQNYNVDLTLLMTDFGLDIDRLLREAGTAGNPGVLSSIAANEIKYNTVIDSAADMLVNK